MNVEEFDELINTIPKVESDNPISTMDSINVEDLRNAVERFKKIPTYQDLLKENQELKEQLEEYEQSLKISKEMLELQGQDGNYNYDNYMLGLYNGMEYIISLFEKREPIYKDGKNIVFLEDKNKNQQKEFIE